MNEHNQPEFSVGVSGMREDSEDDLEREVRELKAEVRALRAERDELAKRLEVMEWNHTAKQIGLVPLTRHRTAGTEGDGE